MSLELVNTLATLATCVVIATTAIAALVQLRHLRASNQIAGQLAINALIQSEEFTTAQIAITRIKDLLNDPKLAWAFHAPISPDLPPEVIAVRRAARVVGSNLENVGNMIRHRLTDGELFVEQFGNVVCDMWELLEPLARILRVIEKSDAVWEDFEQLTILSRDWLKNRQTAFPHVRRILPPWQEIELPPMPSKTEKADGGT